ncbi:unnamed protein product [Mycena citricolor]|uniref:Sphingolipid long chain base-responsive protein LSP1 n=1 Tax=Mycena citricolor TaxID=2018698 RepID=A0AAD2HQE8_9AGAR|nr:unnamed protein product [Mycena citricolor]
MSGFLSSIADKVLPSSHESIHHHLRTITQQYSSSTTPTQRLITVEKGVTIDLDALGRDAKAQSKELYTWGFSEDSDLKDVSDRLAYLNFVQGALASSLAEKLNAARTPFKNLRDAEAALLPRRNARAALQLQLNRIEHDQPRGLEKRTAELKEQLKKLTLEDQPQEKQARWEAIREYAEKLVILSQAAPALIAALPTLPPTEEHPYAGAQSTGAIRAALQRALDNYKTGHVDLVVPVAGADLNRSDTRSFGETHASELSSINSEAPSAAPVTPPAELSSPQTAATSPPISSHPAPIDPSSLNLSPALIPKASTDEAPLVADATNSSAPVPPPVPTVAETGVPLSAGEDGPGPASGSLRDIKSTRPAEDAPVYGFGGTQKFESAVEEKQRLQAYSHAAQEAPPAVHFESAEEEKKRLQREESARASAGPSTGTKPSDEPEDLPPSYQD